MSEENKIEKLKGEENYMTWRIIMKVILECGGLFNVVNGTELPPGDDAEQYQDKLNKWMRDNCTAKKKIMLTLETEPLLRVAGCNTAKEIWDKLKKIYDTQSEENIDLLRHKFHNIEWDNNGGVQGHLAKFDDVQTKMTLLGKPIDEGDMCARLLQTLPKEFDNIYITWHDLDQKEKTWSKLQKRLLNYEIRINVREESMEASAMLSKLKLEKSSKNNFKKECTSKKHMGNIEGKRCFSCGKLGHLSNNCKIGLVCFKCKRKGHKSNDCPKINKNIGCAMLSKHIREIDMLKCDELWIADSGASHHVNIRKDWYTTFTTFSIPKRMDCARQGIQIEAIGTGTINVLAFDGREWCERYFEDVWYCPDGSYNLFSIRKAGHKGIDQNIEDHGKVWTFSRDGKTLALAISNSKNDLYHLLVKVIPPKNEKTFIAKNETSTLQEWHERMGHQNEKHVYTFLKNHNINVNLENEFCEGCVLGKHHRMTFGERVDKSTRAGQLIFADVCGPMEVNDLHGHRYYLVFKDDYSSFRATYLLKRKDEVKEKLPNFINMVINQAEISVKEIRTDGGKEFDNTDIHKYTQSIGLKHSLTAPYSPQQCGVAERENRILCEMARSWLQSAPHLPKSLWGEAILAATYTLNRTAPTKEKEKTPIELFLRKATRFEHLKTFGSLCYAWIPGQKRRKFDAKSSKGYMVGYTDCGYKVYFPETNKVVVCRDVKFTPQTVKKSIYHRDSQYSELEEPINGEQEIGEQNAAVEESNFDEEIEEQNAAVEEPNLDEEEIEEQNTVVKEGYSLRNRENIRRPLRYREIPRLLLLREAPDNFEEALKREDAKRWKEAMDEEINSLHKNQTWKLVDLPPKTRVIDNRWVYAVKTDSNGNVIKYKARLVAKGYAQRPGVDYTDTFSPVARFETMRALFGYALQCDWIVKQFDVKTAFLNGQLDEDVYMNQPRGYEDKTQRVCKLLKSLYGLKQASKCWYKCLTDYLIECGLKESSADPCLYYNEKMVIFFHVDDGMIMGLKDYIETFIYKLSTRFELVSHDVDNYLGLQIKITKNTIEINQSVYAEKILQRFGLMECKTLSLPIEPGWMPGDSPLEDVHNYKEIIGSLTYLAMGSRPDLSFAVNVASRAQDQPTKAHYSLVKRILRYIKGTMSEGIKFERSNNQVIEAYSDADYAGDKTTRRSTSGILMKFCGGPVMWKSKLQRCVALSSMEAEYIAASEAAKSLVWLDRLLKEIRAVDEMTVPTLMIDNQSAIKLMKNPTFHERSKHIETRYHYVRQLTEEKKIDVQYIPTEMQAADLLTKGLSSYKLIKMKKLSGMTI